MSAGTAQVVRANSRHLPIADDSVDLVVTSPPYFALRSYQDGGEHYAGQIGDEPTPGEFVSSLLEVTRECVRVLKPSGSLWVNLGDKYAGAPSGPQGATGDRATRSQADTYGSLRGYNERTCPSCQRVFTSGRNKCHECGVSTRMTGPRAPVPKYDSGVRAKSLIGIPWRYALRCIDDLGLILRAEVIWSKPNGLPESVTDRVRRSHEQWFHFTLSPRYFSAVDEIRERHVTHDALTRIRSSDYDGPMSGAMNGAGNPLGKLPGSVWTVPTEPLRVPDNLGIDHFAAFPTEWPKRIIQGWSPAVVCAECGTGRNSASDHCGPCAKGWDNCTPEDADECCPVTSGVVLDPFGGTGTTAMVAKALGRHGISVDMSADYCRLAQWRTNDRNQLAKVLGVAKVDAVDPAQLDLFGGAA